MRNTTRTRTWTWGIDKESAMVRKFNDQPPVKNAGLRRDVDDEPAPMEVDEDGTPVHLPQHCQGHASPSSNEDPYKLRNPPTEPKQKPQKSPRHHINNSLEHHILNSPTWRKSAKGRVWSADSKLASGGSAPWNHAIPTLPERPTHRGRTITPHSEYDEGTRSYQSPPTSAVRFSGSASDSDDDKVSEDEFTSSSPYKGPPISAVRSSGFEPDPPSDDELAHSPSTQSSRITHLGHINPLSPTSRICDPDPDSESLGSSDSESSDEDYMMDDDSPSQLPKYTPGGLKTKLAPPHSSVVAKTAARKKRRVEIQRERIPCGDPDCRATFSRKTDLIRHLKTAKRHKEDKGEVKAGRHICSSCGRDFSRTDALQRHKRKFCTGVRRSRGIESDE